MLDLFNVSTMHHLNYSGQESKKRFAVYDSDTPVTLNKVKVVKLDMHWSNPSKVVTMQSLKEFPFTVSAKKPMLKFLSKQKTQLSPLNMCKSEKQWYIHYLFDLLNYHTKFQIRT